MTDFEPADVVVLEHLPFVGCFDHVEAEVAAALLVLALQFRGWLWVPVAFDDVAAMLGSGVVRGWMRNPFVPPPDFAELVERGYASDPFDTRHVLHFTARGIERLRRYART